ncbi:MAG: DNA primase [Peptostreptococcaceae bacterium]|nr:DNA primase [Peptostreptococcaceae bacterium]
MARSMNDIVDEIKSRINIVDVVGRYVSLKKAGNNYKGRCPFHNEKTPSFIVSEQKQIYKCFGCDEGGDVIRFVMKVENIDFMDSLDILGKEINIDVKKELSNDFDKSSIKKKRKYYDMNLYIAKFYFNNLKNDNQARNYLEDRGLSNKIINRFGIGFASDSWEESKKFLKDKNFLESEIYENGLITKTKKGNFIDKFRNRIIFPIFNIKNEIIGFGGRVIDNKSIPKYLNSPETIVFNKRYNLYALNFVRKYSNKDYIIVVEGYMDVVSLNQYGITNVVASLGTALTIEQVKLLKRYYKKIVLCYDMDDAGVKATNRAIELLNTEKLNVKVLTLEDCKDPDEYIRKKGISKFNNRLQNAVTDIEFFIEQIRKKHNLNNSKEKTKYTQEVCSLLKTIDSEVKKEYYVKLLSKETDIAYDVISGEVFGGKKFKKDFNKKTYSKKNFKKKMLKNENLKIKFNKNDILEKNLILTFIEAKNFELKTHILKLEKDYMILDMTKEFLNSLDSVENFNLFLDKYQSSLQEFKELNYNDSLDFFNSLDILKKEIVTRKIKKLSLRQKELEKNKDGNENLEKQLIEIANEIMSLKKSL